MAMMVALLLRRWRKALLIALCLGAGSAYAEGEAGLRLMSPRAHGGSVDAIAIDPRAELVATGGSDQRIHLWHLPSARQWRSLGGHSASIRNLAFSPDGSLLASGDEDGVVRVWRVADGASLCSWKNTDQRDPQMPADQPGMRVAWVGRDALWSVGQRGFARQWRLGGCAETAHYALHDSTTWDALRDREGWTLATHDAVLRLNAEGKPQWRIALDTYPSRLVHRAGGNAVLLSDGRLLEFDPRGRLASAPGVQITRGLGMSLVALGDGWLASDGSRVLQRVRAGQIQELSPLDGLEGDAARRLLNVTQLAVAGNTLVAASSQGLLVLDAATLARKAVLDVPGADYHHVLAASAASARMLLGGISDAVLWDLQAGRPLGTLRLPDPQASIDAALFTPEGRALLLLVRAGDGSGKYHLLYYSLDSGRFLAPVALPDIGFALAFDAPRERVLVAAKGGVLAYRVADLAPLGRLGSLGYVEYLDVSPDGSHLIAANGKEAELITLADAQVQTRWAAGEAYEALGGFIRGVQLDRKADTVWFASHGAVAAFDAAGTRRWRTELPEDIQRQLLRSPDGRSLLAAGSSAALLDARSGVATALDLPAAAASIAYLDARNALMLGADGVVRLWQAAPAPVLEWRSLESSGASADALVCRGEAGLCGLIPPWIAATTDGRFDLADFATLPQAVWYDARDPYRPLQLEWFARKAFTPRLIGRALAQQLPPALPLQARAVSPPRVRIASIAAQANDPKQLRVGLEIEPGSAPLGGVQLYRDGIRVARVPASALQRSGKRFTALIEPVRVSDLVIYEPVRIEAIAFDTDGIRSSMARRDHKVVADSAAPWVAPRTWLVNIGVNRHENPAFDLAFAANDARRLGSALSAALAKGDAESVVRVPLIADTDPAAASKARIREALQVLAGAAPRSADPQLAPLDRARPADTVMISFSGHGLVGADGEFYLLPGDTGAGEGRQVTPALLAHAISSKELTEWLDGLDADQVTLVLDACHAAAAVDVNGFMPGPMDSAGLGQLAYDKGFAVLVATQADDVALESGRLQQGLLTYALTADALDARAADFAPRDGRIDRLEWLRYGVTRVPDLARRIRNGELAPVSGSRGVSRIGAATAPPPLAQTPALFYFPRGRGDIRLLDLPR